MTSSPEGTGSRCLRDSPLPTVIAVDEPSADSLTILTIRQGNRPGTLRIGWPGAHRRGVTDIDDTMTLAELIDRIRQAHDHSQED